ncbi:hypothetical protein [Anaeromyxobacter oryzae]|uniref:Uncharacterized protein n=1 Tax=Anaeromyxobacter oryzae TaxID=2918170 RepID=A0ABM7WQM3_9BACT|nr:hypothetical protein [Anaeromyxobacter oryzae]BDG01767.1 hypothetical protein AMOR_07630 [Anaeromyxobacter oryzae]
MRRAEPYYRGIRGSAALATDRLAPDAVPAEALEAGEMRRVPFAGELLGAVRVRSAFAPIPLDVFDRASAVLEAEEQAAYLHLLRLSYAEGRNWCRAGKKDLMARLRLSERRLLRVLDALVTKRFARPLHRDNRGTLWRVYLPAEAAGERVGDEVLLGRAAPAAVPAPLPDEQVARTRSGARANVAAGTPRAAPGLVVRDGERPPSRRPSPAAVAGGADRGDCVRRGSLEGELARALAAARGERDATGLARAEREIRDLLAEGQAPARIAACIETVRRRAARAAGEGTP